MKGVPGALGWGFRWGILGSVVVGARQGFLFLGLEAWFLEGQWGFVWIVVLGFVLFGWYYQVIIKLVHKKAILY